ncbi:protein AF-9 homolog [Trichomonascus vanleenenianus]|uniref:YEATS domain-containing protein YAF9 n=1 Tax=Trichomonascus vanleenenianus TaxID=2268995 RepID=UPI003ECB4E41
MVANKRIKNVSISRPILYGNTARPLEENEKTADTPPDHTHKWTIFVRDPNNPSGEKGKNDLSYFIKKVVFKLHDTYPNPSRSIEEPPFEVTETGWGEFEIAIRIFFHPEAGEKNVTLYHHLKLHPYLPEDQASGSNTAVGSGPGPVESYLYDELVFNEPTESMFQLLTSKPGAVIPTKKSAAFRYSMQSEHEEFEKLSSALDTVYQQVQKTKEQIVKLEKQKQALEAKQK